MKNFISKNKNLPPEVKNTLLPREEFITHGKEGFLAAFDASPLGRLHPESVPFSWTTLFFKFGVGAMAVVAISAGVSVYADTANVSATDPLYSLKRIGENVQLAVVPTQQKAKLQATFAVRRVNEIQALEQQQPSSTLIPSLTAELDDSISSSFNTASQTSSSQEDSLNVFCKTFVNTTSSVFFTHLENNLVLHPNLLARFNHQCGSESSVGTGDASGTVNSTSTQNGHQGDGNRGVDAPVPPVDQHGGSSTWNSTTTLEASSTIEVSTTLDIHHDGGEGNQDNIHSLHL